MKARIIGVAIIAITGITIAFFMISNNKKLGIYSPDELDNKLVDISLQSKMSGHNISSCVKRECVHALANLLP